VRRPLAWRVRLDDEVAHRDAGRAVLSASELGTSINSVI
jgi:hypothetical protein